MSAPVPLVGIGASSGGLEAFGSLLECLPSRIGAAVIFVSHLERNHESVLSEILARKSAMPVLAAIHGCIPQADHIYVIVPNVTLTVVKNRLHLEPRAAGRLPHHPVNALFQSLATERGTGAIGIVLSGADSDGTAGMQAIKQAGGITIVQDPVTAGVPSMPKSAIETGCVDLILPSAQIAAELVRLLAHPYLSAESTASSSIENDSPLESSEESSLQRVFRRLRAAHGVDFSRYKLATLRRRLARRMALQKSDDLSGYIDFLEHDAAETAALYQDFLIRVTGFFRDPEVFKALSADVFPALGSHRDAKESIRIWVPGCATGEEVYSIAIALVEHLEGHESPIDIQVFGTDVNESSIEKARAGFYPDSIEEDVSPERLKRFFIKENSRYCIGRHIRDLCIFARQDVTRDPPFSRLDLISCRNLLIYLSPASQRRVMQTFHYALRKQGYLLLGLSESVGQASEGFELQDKTHRFYRRTSAEKPPGAEPSLYPIAEPAGRRSVESTHANETSTATDTALRQADRWFLSRYAPAGILIDNALNILQFRGEVGPYLAPASGPPSLHLNSVVRPELLPNMRVALDEVRASGKIAHRLGLTVEGIGRVDLEVVPLPRIGAAPCYLFVFEDESRRPVLRGERPGSSGPTMTESEKDGHISRLERENADMREFLQATMEQHEAAKDALRAAHEEVLSANEEFQSTNEELETSKEELQSGNEELRTTNDELRDRNSQLGILNSELDMARKIVDRARAYADGIIESIREPLVVLDGDLRVMRGNPAFYATFGLRPDLTEGTLFYEIGEAQWNITSLRDRLLRVLSGSDLLTDEELTFAETNRPLRQFRFSARRIVGDSERAALILLSMEDVTESHTKAEQQREGSRRKDEFLAMLAHELRNPLGPINNAVQLLRQGNPDTPHLLDMITRQTTRLVRLVDELLDVARISRGLVELLREPLDLAAVVRNAAEANRPRLEQRAHILTVEVPDRPVMVYGDAVRMEQVIANLLENAIKYTNPGGRIAIRLIETGGNALLTIADNGIGLAHEALERIFELFSQVDSSLARSGGGLGLGLTVVRRILEMHGGQIEARSEGVGKGSEFVVRIPLLANAPLPVKKAADSMTHVDLIPRRVLIVDDNVDAAQTMSMLISEWGHETRVAHTAQRALELAAQFAPETALLDIGLPDMDGYALARQLRMLDANGGLQLIAMTGYGRAEDRLAAREAGFDIHLIKPADLDEIARILSRQGTKH